MLRRSVHLLTILLLTSLVAVAEPPQTTPPTAAPTTAPTIKLKFAPHYLSPDAIKVDELLPDPPAVDSPEHQAELDLLLKLQHDRTPDDVARCKMEENHMSVFIFADVLGPNFTPYKCPKTANFFQSAINADIGYFNKQAKNHFSRPRPDTDSRIHSLFHETDGSYPSGHSIRATVLGELLAAAVPDHRDALIAKSQQIGWDREIAGVHFSSDIFAGRVLGKAIALALLANPDVKAQVDEMKAEIEKNINP